MGTQDRGGEAKLIKEWVEELLEKIGEDRTPEQIAESRKVVGKLYRRRGEIKAWVECNYPQYLDKIVELKGWLESWFRYFDDGEYNRETIEEIKGKIVKRLEWIAEHI